MNKNIKSFINKNGADILTGVGIAGWIGTSVLASRDGVRTQKMIDTLEEELGRKLTKKEKAILIGKGHWRSIAAGTFSTACITTSAVMSHKKITAISGALGAVSSAYSTYKTKIEKIIDEGKDVKTEARDNNEAAISAARVKQNESGKSGVRMRDEFGREFISTEDKIRLAVERLNNVILSSCDNCASLNVFYTAADLDETEYGDIVGWNIADKKVDVEFEALYENEELILKYRFTTIPRTGYDF